MRSMPMTWWLTWQMFVCVPQASYSVLLILTDWPATCSWRISLLHMFQVLSKWWLTVVSSNSMLYSNSRWSTLAYAAGNYKGVQKCWSSFKSDKKSHIKTNFSVIFFLTIILCFTLLPILSLYATIFVMFVKLLDVLRVSWLQNSPNHWQINH